MANGQARAGRRAIKIWGTDGDWAMIGYGLSNNLYEIGCIPASVLSPYVSMQPISFSYREVTVIPRQPDGRPDRSPNLMFEIPAGTCDAVGV